MLFFGHIGITTGIVKVCQELIAARKPGNAEPSLESQSGTKSTGKRLLVDNIRDKMRAVDYRFVLLGSLLPDIIDKPVWMFTSSNFQWDGRGYAHTFLFNFVLFVAGLILATRRNKTWLLTISLCSFIHLVLDQMWLNPATLLWPLLGSIQRGATAGWFSTLWHELISDPYVYASETVGFIINLYTGFRLLMRGRVMHFLKTGHIGWGKTAKWQ
jgi:membrane-bound metal-dependent hydrolase YbcI (DUF457 family)